MAAMAHLGWLMAALRRLPTPLVIALDAWSYNIARRRAARRRERAAAIRKQLSAQH